MKGKFHEAREARFENGSIVLDTVTSHRIDDIEEAKVRLSFLEKNKERLILSREEALERIASMEKQENELRAAIEQFEGIEERGE